MSFGISMVRDLPFGLGLGARVSLGGAAAAG